MKLLNNNDIILYCSNHNAIPHFKKDQEGVTINSELRNYVYRDMPNDLSPEEEAIYIYCKLCMILHWDIRVNYERSNNTLGEYYSHNIVSNNLESIIPGSSTTCNQICRIAANMINSSSNDLEAIIIEDSESHHLSLLLSSPLFCFVLDPIDSRNPFNDLTNIKLGFSINCFDIIFEESKGLIDNMLHKISDIVFPYSTPIYEYISDLKDFQRVDSSPKALHDILKAFTTMLEESGNLDSDSITRIFNYFSAFSFFGTDIDYSFLLEGSSKESNLKKLICLADPHSEPPYFILDTHTLEVHQYPLDEIKSKFRSGLWKLEDSFYPIPTIE